MGKSGSRGSGRRDEAWSARIVVVQPPDHGPRVARGLEVLAGRATIEIVHDARRCLVRCDAGEVDLVVLDARRRAEAQSVLAATAAGGGPPAVVIEPEASDARALAWFRAGAADCVFASEDAQRLGAAVAEQLRRDRARRAAGGRELGLAGNREVMEQLNSALLVVDLDGRIVYTNPAAEQILGAGDSLHGADAGARFRAVDSGEPLIPRTLRQGERFKGAEALVTRPDGSSVPVGISCAPTTTPEGRRTGAVAIFQDLSEATQRRSQALQTEKLASIGQLAAGVAHEINNPMGFIHANLFQLAEYAEDLQQLWAEVEGLRRTAASGDLEAIRKAADALGEAAERADVDFVLGDLSKAIRESQEGSERIRHIVQDLRDFSHQDTGERVSADLNQCLDSTANIVWPMMKHVVVLERDYAELPPVGCYPMQLKQVFMNLLVNAFQAIEESVGESGELGTIALATAIEGDQVVVSIRDTGVGIPPEHLERIFDPFFTTKRVGAGTGLGLSTSFGIVQGHGGTLTVESRPGGGTTFRLRLPIDPDEAGGS
jgi:two-component system NtrC family sensor kinase